MKAEDFIGLTKKSGQDAAEGRNMIFRLISINGEPFFSYPEDHRDDRVCAELVDGKIAKATIQ